MINYAFILGFSIFFSMVRINFQDEFLKKAEVLAKYPFSETANGYCLYQASVPYSFIDIFTPPSREYAEYFEKAQYAKYPYEARIRNLKRYFEINKRMPPFVQINSEGESCDIRENGKMFDESYVWSYGLDYDFIDEVRYIYQSGFKHVATDKSSVLIIPLLDWSESDLCALEGLVDKYDFIVLKDANIKSYTCNQPVYKNIGWYYSSYKALDSLCSLIFQDARKSIFYWSSDVDRLMYPGFLGSYQFNFLETDMSIFRRKSNGIG